MHTAAAEQRSPRICGCARGARAAAGVPPNGGLGRRGAAEGERLCCMTPAAGLGRCGDPPPPRGGAGGGGGGTGLTSASDLLPEPRAQRGPPCAGADVGGGGPLSCGWGHDGPSDDLRFGRDPPGHSPWGGGGDRLGASFGDRTRPASWGSRAPEKCWCQFTSALVYW